MKQRNLQKGFTLIEMLIYISLLTVILGVVATLLLSYEIARVKNQVVAEVEQQGDEVVQLMTQTIRNAVAVTSPSLGTTASSLTLTVPAGSNSPTVFDLSSGAIRITLGTNSAVNLTSNRIIASALSFENLSQSASTPGTIKIQFTLTHINTANQPEYIYSQTFYDSASLR